MTRIRKISTTAGIFQILILLLVFPDCVQGSDLQFKISGGYSYLKLSEVHRSLDGWAEWIKIEAAENKNWMVLQENVRSMHSGVNLEGEILFFFTPRVSVGLGAGYIYSNINEAKTEVIVERPTGTLSHVFPMTVSAYPVTLSGYYFIPFMSKLSLFFRGGAGLVWAKYVNREGRKFLTQKNYNYLGLQKASASGAILLASLGFVYDSDMGVRFFIEGTTRLSKIKSFSGENELGTKGTLFYFEEYHSDLDLWQASAKILAEKPSSPNIRSVSEAVVDFSGFSAKIGFMIRF